MQLGLFDNPEQSKPPAIARRSDPKSSHDAAAAIAPKLGGLQALFVETLKANSQIPLTANEVAERAIAFTRDEGVVKTLQRRESLRKRAKELVKAGMIRECEKRFCRAAESETEVTTYEVI